MKQKNRPKKWLKDSYRPLPNNPSLQIIDISPVCKFYSDELLPMYPYKTELDANDIRKIEKYRLSDADLDVLRKWIPDATRDNPNIVKLESILLEQCNQPPTVIKGLDWPQILSLLKRIESGDGDGCVAKDKYKWQKVQNEVQKRWDSLKKENQPFPSFRAMARDIKRNAGTVKKAILYSRSLTQAYNKDKPVSKKVKYIEPSKLDFVGIKTGQKGGKPDPIYEAAKDNLLKQIKRAACKEANDFDPDVKTCGKLVQRNMKLIYKFPNERLIDLLEDLSEKRTDRVDKIRAAFETNRLK